MGIFRRKGKAAGFADRRFRQGLAGRLIQLDEWARRRFDYRVPEDHVDLLLAHYLYGATSAEQGRPRERLQFCLDLLTDVLGSRRAYRALFDTPDDMDGAVAELCRKMEKRGSSEVQSLKGL